MADLRADNRLKCKFCGWTCAKWKTNRKQERVSGFAKLRRHVIEEHESEPAAQLARDNLEEESWN